MKTDKDIYCNMCGKKIRTEKGIPREDFLSVKKKWGYFSGQDGLQYEFELCEECCRRFTEQFQIPVTVTEPHEWL